MYFTVSAYKWDANVDEGENIDNTRISFTLAVTITQFYGLTSLFADTDIALEMDIIQLNRIISQI